MSIDSYNDLVEKVPQWAERSDISADLIKDFIFLAESDANQLLRVPAMEDDIRLPVTDGRITIPFDFMELRRLTDETGHKVLKYLPWDQFVAYDKDGGSGQEEASVTYFSRQGPRWYLSPTPSDGTNILCHYYRMIPALADSYQSNWLLTISPTAYLYGALKYLFEYVMDQERAAYWEKKFNNELTKLQAIAERAEHTGSHLIVRQS